MENGNAFICACSRRYSITSFIALCIIATVIVYNIYLQPSYVPHVGRQQCAWSKTKKKVLRCCETPPWLLLLADYKNTTTSDRNLYIWPDLQLVNRLGNRLFTYAAIFGIAWRNRRIPIWPEKSVYKNADVTRFFNLRIPVDRNNTITHSGLTRPQSMSPARIGIYDSQFEHLSTRNITTKKLFQSYKYFEHVDEELRRDFTFKPNITETARRWLNDQTPDEWKDEEFVRVVIHVRRTDRANPSSVRDGWPLPTNEYFRRSMSHFTDCLERVQFVVLSDDPAWCREHIHATNIVYSSGHSPIVDLAIASLCDHAIITIGTYSWWVAWFANGVTVTQKNIPTNGSDLSRRLSRSDYYKPDWIGL